MDYLERSVSNSDGQLEKQIVDPHLLVRVPPVDTS